MFIVFTERYISLSYWSESQSWFSIFQKDLILFSSQCVSKCKLLVNYQLHSGPTSTQAFRLIKLNFQSSIVFFHNLSFFFFFFFHPKTVVTCQIHLELLLLWWWFLLGVSKWEGYRVLVPWPGIKTMPPTVEPWSPNPQTAREFPV